MRPACLVLIRKDVWPQPCPANHVLAKMRSHKTDSQEWAGFYCCPLK